MGLKFSIFQRYTTQNTRSMTLDQDKCCNDKHSINDTENYDTKNHMQNIHHEERPNKIKILFKLRPQDLYL